MDTLDPDLVKLFCILLGVIFVGTVIAGATNKVVIFFNLGDLINTIMIFICPLVIGGGGMVIFQDHNGEINETTETIILVLTVITTAFCILKCFMLSIKYNKNIFVGLFIGFMKTVIAILGVLILIGYISDVLNDKKNSIGGWILSVLILGFFVWLGKKLVNGQSVYNEKGWAV